MLTIEAKGPPRWFRGLNWMGGALSRLGLRAADMDPTELLDKARQKTGLSDFGGDDFLEPLSILVESLAEEGALHPLGRLAAERRLVRLLSQRLRVQRALSLDPEIERVPIERPLFIVGLPRTGTTLLHHLLSRAPGARAPLLWELLHPAPLSASQRGPDSRIELARRELRALQTVLPAASTLHPMEAEGPEECLWAFELSFRSLGFEVFFQAPRYRAYLAQADMAPLYRYYRSLLQLLSRQRGGGRWVLKTPYHLPCLDTVRAVFPDARFVFTHRDPRTVAASCCSLWEGALSIHNRGVDPRAIGPRWLANWGGAMDQALRAREGLSPGAAFDLDYDRLVASPIEAARAIHQHFDLPFDGATEGALGGWLQGQREGAHTQHRYDLGRYGLDPTQVTARFSAYLASRRGAQ